MRNTGLIANLKPYARLQLFTGKRLKGNTGGTGVRKRTVYVRSRTQNAKSPSRGFWAKRQTLKA